MKASKHKNLKLQKFQKTYRRLAQHPCDIHIQNTGKTENNYKLEFFKLKTSTYQKAHRLRKQKNASHREGI